jgi:hypothetical protein
MDDYTSLLSVMDHDQWVLSVKLFALAVMLGLGLWRIRTRRQEHDGDRRAGEEREFDMRRDGQIYST